MFNSLRTSAFSLIVGAISLIAVPDRAQAQSYQIDCAILLCLSGGWPASVPCARARAEFIRRITPWPWSRLFKSGAALWQRLTQQILKR